MQYAVSLFFALALSVSAHAAQSQPTEADEPLYHIYLRGLLDGMENPERYAANDQPQFSTEVLENVGSLCREERTSRANCFVAGAILGRRRELAFQASGAPGEDERRAWLCQTQREAQEQAREAGISRVESAAQRRLQALCGEVAEVTQP